MSWILALCFPDDSCTDIFLGQVRTVDGDIGIFGVKLETFPKEVLKALLRSLGDATRVVVVNPRPEGTQLDIEKDDGADGLKVSHPSLAVDDAAACGDDVILQLEIQQNGLFDPSKFPIAVHIDDMLQFSTLRLFDERVRVHELARQLFCQDRTDGAFA